MIKELERNLDVHDSDDEKNLRKYKQRYGKNISLCLPNVIIKKQKTAKDDRKKSIKFG